MAIPLLAAGAGAAGAGAAGAGAAGAGAAGAGAASGIFGIPWAILVPALLSVFGGLFEKKEDPVEEAMKMKQAMDAMGIQAPYQSPYLPQINEAAMKAVMAQLGRTANWGWPEGQGVDTSWIQDMISKIQPAAAYQGVRGVSPGLQAALARR